jgi:drug/metabolite transporter (DMT)-like permease
LKKAFIQLHIAVLLAGLTGILGKLIHLNEGLLVWYRLLLTATSLWLLALIRRQSIRIDPKDLWRIFGIGGIAALHWVSFYGSIKYSNVSVALLCFSSIGFFTALIEPMLFRHRIDTVELMLGALVIVGIFFIFQVGPHYKTGIIVGLISALLGSLFPVLNKRILDRVSAENVTLYELSGGFLFLSALMPLYLYLFPTPYLRPGWQDWIWLLILAWACTVLAFNLSMSALKKISAFTVNLSYNLEPVYGILLAFLVFREDKYFNTGFYIGFFLIVLSIVLQTVRLRRRQLKKAAAGSLVGMLLAGSLLSPDTVRAQDPSGRVAAFGNPRHYVCYYTSHPIRIDGVADEPVWKNVPWTDDFIDIEGAGHLKPAFRTRAKLLWDSSYLYIFSELEEPGLQGVLQQHDTIIYQDNDFEVFLNPDNNTHNYFELEFNALGTVMDLFMFRPYRDGGKALMSWDAQGMRSAVKRTGTLNQPGDQDEGWSVEMAIPLATLRFFGDKPPRDSSLWRINFSRVEWDWDVKEGQYVKRVDPVTGRKLPGHNWVWSPQGIIDMHAPERWGYLQFSSRPAGAGQVAFAVPADEQARQCLWLIYYRQRDYMREHGVYASNLEAIGLESKVGGADKPGGYTVTLEGLSTAFTAEISGSAFVGKMTIDQDGEVGRRH